METTIQVKSAILSPDKKWYNIKDVNGKEYSIALMERDSDKPKNEKLKQAIETAQDVPYSLTGDIYQNKDRTKTFIADPKPKNEYRGGGKGTPKNDKLSLAQTCINASCNMISESSGAFDNEKHLVDKALSIAESLYAWGALKGEL